MEARAGRGPASGLLEADTADEQKQSASEEGFTTRQREIGGLELRVR